MQNSGEAPKKGFFKETRRFVIIDDGVHVERDVWGIAHTRGAIK